MSLKQKAVRVFVERLMKGERNENDVSEIFAWLRFKSFGNNIVKEIAHLVAHNDERDRGVAWNASNDFVSMMSMFLRGVLKNNYSTSLPNDIESISEGLHANLRRIGEKRCKEQFGFSLSKAKKYLDLALSKISTAKGTQVVIKEDFTENENKVFKFLGNTIISTPEFDHIILEKQIIDALLKNKLIDKSEIELMKSAMPFIMAYVVCKMHGTELTISGKSNGTLYTVPSQENGKLVVVASLPAEGLQIQTVFTLFNTNCDPNELCTKKLLDYKGNWANIALYMENGLISYAV